MRYDGAFREVLFQISRDSYIDRSELASARAAERLDWTIACRPAVAPRATIARYPAVVHSKSKPRHVAVDRTRIV